MKQRHRSARFSEGDSITASEVFYFTNDLFYCGFLQGASDPLTPAPDIHRALMFTEGWPWKRENNQKKAYLALDVRPYCMLYVLALNVQT